MTICRGEPEHRSDDDVDLYVDDAADDDDRSKVRRVAESGTARSRAISQSPCLRGDER